MPNRLSKTAQYILNNPGKALTLSLAGQVLGGSAVNHFQDSSSMRDANLTQGFHLTKPFLNDSLALIEQRALPALNLTWLNQSDINQMELVPEAWLNTNDTFLDKNLHRTKRENPHDLELANQDAVKDCITAISNEDLRQAGKIWHDLMPLDHAEVALRKIIERVYRGDVDNFDKLESFILKGLDSVESQLVACQLLQAEIIKYDQLFTSESLRLAYNFRRFMRRSSYLELTPEFKLLCESAKSKFPQAVNYLLGSGFCLKSVAHNNEYLYASWFKMPNKRDKRVFTWVPSQYAGAEAVWRVESYKNGKTFYIFNAKQHAYLHAVKDQYDDDRRYVIGLEVRGLRSEWRVQLLAGTSEIILLNDYYGETLYNSFKYDDNRRYVFTWLKGPIRSARWRVEACGSSTRQQRRDTPDLTLNIKQIGLENVTAPINNATVDTFLDKNLHRTKRDDRPNLEIEDLVEDCITAIRNGDLKQAEENWQDLLTLDRNAVALTRIIKNVYGGHVCNFDKIDNFIKDVLSTVETKAVAYKTLLLEMRRNDQLFTPEILRLAYRFDQVMNYPDYLKVTPEVKSLGEFVKSNMPQAVQYLLYSKVCLRSMAQNNEYLYASWFNRSDNKGKHVFTWVPDEYAGVEAVWRFGSYDDGITFYIYNPRQHAYLHTIDDEYNADRRNVVVQPAKGPLGRWRIQLLATEPEIILWNDFYGETLYAASINYNDHRRYVFTWVKGPVPSARWRVEDCESSYSRQRRDTSDIELENIGLTLNAKQLFFQLKPQVNQMTKTSDLNREAIEEPMFSQLNKTVL